MILFQPFLLQKEEQLFSWIWKEKSNICFYLTFCMQL